MSACDVVGGQHLGFILDPQQCTYDPAKDATALCTGAIGTNGVVGTNATAACVTPTQATAQNKIWFGQTADGSVPDAAANNGFNANLTSNQLWYGLTPGRDQRPGRRQPVHDLVGHGGARAAGSDDRDAGVHQRGRRTALNGWRNLTYGQLANAFAQGIALQPFFGNINTDSADLKRAKERPARRSSSTTAAPTTLDPAAELDQLLHAGRQSSTAASRRRRRTTACS